MLAHRTTSALCTGVVVAALLVSGGRAAASPRTDTADGRHPVVAELASFAASGCTGGCGSGSTIGPDGALYVTDGKAGRVLRIDPETGAETTYAHGLPPSIDAVGIGGAIDVAFLGSTAYVLVTAVGPALGQPDVVDGIYRVEADGAATAIADVGAWSVAHPPQADVAIASGVQYAMQPDRGGFLVTDGHHNRVIRVELDGTICEVLTLDNTVPTGLDVRGRRVYVSEAGPVPHVPKTGRVISFTRRSRTPRITAAGARMLVDVEFGPRRQLFVLSQGVWDLPNLPENAGQPASPNTGALLRLTDSSRFVPVAQHLDRPTSLEIAGRTAYVVTLTGKVLRISGLSARH